MCMCVCVCVCWKAKQKKDTYFGEDEHFCIYFADMCFD